MLDYLFGHLEDPGEALRRAYLWASPMLLVYLTGLVMALVSLGSKHKRPALVCLSIGLGLLLLRTAAHPWWIHHVNTSDMWMDLDPDQFRLRLGIYEFTSVAIDVVGTALVIASALAWRGASFGTTAGTSRSAEQLSTDRAAFGELPALSYGLRFSAMYVPIFLSMICSGFAITLLAEDRTLETGLAVLVVGLLLLIVGVVAFAFTIHALWKTIQPPPTGVGLAGVARTTPAKAVGFLFIPLFSIYWVFQVWVGLATDMNRTLDERGLEVPHISRGLAITVCVFTVASMIPYVGALFSLVNLVLLPIFLWSAFRAANALRSGSTTVSSFAS